MLSRKRGGDNGRRENRIARQFHALADPNRLWILELLDEEERNGQGILEAVPIVQSTLSHHMKILGEARLVDIRREGNMDLVYAEQGEPGGTSGVFGALYWRGGKRG